MSGTSGARWYVLRTKPRSEVLASVSLRSRGIEVYFPRLVVGAWARPAMGAHAATEPLFPGYLFVHLELPAQFGTAAWSPGVRGLVGFEDGRPEPIDDAILALLRQRAGGGDVLSPRQILQPGEPVEVRRGPFSGLLGVIERPVNGAGRVRVLLEILRRQTRVELRADAVVRL